MKSLLPILFWLWHCLALAQVKEVVTVGKKDTLLTKQYKPEILTSGFIDIVNNGQVNASARFIRLFIGEPGNMPNGKRRFAIPLSVYSGVSSSSFTNGNSNTAATNSFGLRNNEHLVNSFINPLSGLFNVSADGIAYFKKPTVKVTRSGFIYHGGLRVLTGYRVGMATNPSTGKPLNFFNTYATAGFYFQTGAWERNNAKNVGVFWLAGRYIICKSSAGQLKEIIPPIQTNGFYHGWSLGGGIEINSLINIKVVYYKYVKKPELDYSLPIYQFSFNYSLKN
jgi:hypothetical protein